MQLPWCWPGADARLPDTAGTNRVAAPGAASQCCSNYQSNGAKQTENTLVDNAKLEQNNPNPFSENSIIKFYIPTSANNAMIKIYSLNGTEMNSFNNLSKGLGQVTVNANSLAPGVYVYALIVDGKTTETKQMIVTK